jgi:ABC-type sulfate transport system permease component
MKKSKMNRHEQILLSLGLLLVTSGSLIKDWIHIPDIFFRGLIIGIGIGMEFMSLVLYNRRIRRAQDSDRLNRDFKVD